ncbi:unnamed protein product [Diatraea saccharalis]|uniref:Peptidase S1 domain-containing protein n=1 Tax=Diatraea saccharalis TaxID=40085 RepID=A0A9N9R5E7_9NEOP|nr:unnamed protein product [Diatraea saccharalis]
MGDGNHLTSGGGQSSELRSVSVPVWDINDCHQILGTSRKLPNGPTSDNQICAGEKQGGKDTCQGDSGGPAQIQDGCAWRVVAVTSVGRSCGAPNTPALYAIIHRSFVAAQVFGKGISTQQTSQNINRQDYTTVNNKNNANRHNERENLSSHKNNNDYILPENVNVNNNHKQNINKQDYINLNNNNNNRDVNYNYNHERGDNINLNNKNNNNAYIIPDVATNSNHRQNVNYNNNYTPHVIGDYSDTVSGEHNYYNQNKNYEIETPSPSHNKFHSIRSPDYIYNPSPHDNNRQYGGYNGNVNVNNNYDVGFPEQSYTVTEAPRFNNGRNWWQPY